ncbi:hypothetical protein PCASD_06971 [Puccinia coronata f. sp. avenae]|uniref:Uncharacterized protein n=1 Tax=Puccinia coronata f. sp. avenae TaxID=200324 RepID=A0A2N5V4T2_9BASI|nr:hypothetical protein PCASD_06971 [Puccinia coronata f. sp. avenae]
MTHSHQCHDKKSSSHHHRRRRSRSRSSTASADEDRGGKPSRWASHSHLPAEVDPISADHFFQKSLEFKHWLKHKKNKYIDQLDSSKSKKYFDKFVRHWNKGKLDHDYYNPPIQWRTASSATTSSHSWTFKGATTLDREKARAAREEASIGPSLPASSSRSQRAIIGPSLPPGVSSSSCGPSTLAEYQYKADEARDAGLRDSMERKNELKRKRKEEREEVAADRATGKDRLLEKRKELRDAQADYQRERDDPTAAELDDRSLFGPSNSFQEAIRARDRAQERRMNKKGNFKVEKQLVMQEKVAAMKSKEDETMAMFKALAASKFGPSAGSRP